MTRIKLQFNIVNSEGIKTIPVNYNYELHKVISGIIENQDKKIKDYCFSEIYFQKHKINDKPVYLSKDKKDLVLKNTRKLEFFFSSTDIEKIEYLIYILKKRKYIKFYNLILEFDKYDVFNIELEDKEKIDINFITKTPVFLQLEINDKKYVFHPLPKNKNINEEQLNEYIKLLKNNIRHKYNTNEDFILKLYDIKYKPLIIKEHRKDSYLFSFNIIASKELVEKIYYGGIGNNTGLGMGFVTLKNK